MDLVVRLFSCVLTTEPGDLRHHRQPACRKAQWGFHCFCCVDRPMLLVCSPRDGLESLDLPIHPHLCETVEISHISGTQLVII